MNRVKAIRSAHNLLQAKASMRTGLTVEQIREMVYNQAFKYLTEILEVDIYGLTHLPNTPQFWAWWRIEWARVDRIFLERISVECPHDQARAYYVQIHDSVSTNRYINGAVMHASKSKLIEELHLK